MIKAIFFDVDGTLVSFYTHKVPKSTVEALTALRQKGIKLFVATGRKFESINNLGRLQFDGYITLNGGFCLAGTDQVIYKHSIPSQDIDALLTYQQTVEPFPCAFVCEDGIYMNYKNESVDKLFKMLNFPQPPIRPLQEVSGKTVFQLIAFFSKGREKRIMSVLPHCESTRWNPLFTDVVPAGSNKAVGIDKIIEHYGIAPDETMAFGDGGNDVAMLSHAHIGVAMGNADNEVKEKADYITDSVDENGIFNALKHFNLI